MNGPNQVEPGKWTNPVRKVQLEIDENLGGKVTGTKLGASRTFHCGISFEILPFLVWFVSTIWIRVLAVLVDYTFALHVTDVKLDQKIEDLAGWLQALKMGLSFGYQNLKLRSRFFSQSWFLRPPTKLKYWLSFARPRNLQWTHATYQLNKLAFRATSMERAAIFDLRLRSAQTWRMDDWHVCLDPSEARLVSSWTALPKN